MPCFTVRVANENDLGNPGVRFFLDKECNIVKNYIVLFESTIYIAEKNIESLLEKILQNSDIEKNFFNKVHNKIFKWHVGKQKYNINNSIFDELPLYIREYKLKSVGVAIAEQKDKKGINGNILILYTENNQNYSINEQVNEIELSLHIKIVEESVDTYWGGGIKQLLNFFTKFNEAVAAQKSFFTEALSFAQKFKNENIKLPQNYYVYEKGKPAYCKYLSCHKAHMQPMVKTELDTPSCLLTQFNSVPSRDQKKEKNYTQPKENKEEEWQTKKRKNIHQSCTYN